MPLVFDGAEAREEVCRLMEQLQRSREEAGRLRALLESRGTESRELRVEVCVTTPGR
jgi:hypothetical protein